MQFTNKYKLAFIVLFNLTLNWCIIRSSALLSSVKKESLGSIIIRLKNGQLIKANRNSVKEFTNERTQQNEFIVYEFLSVPFAQAPLNDKRFQFPYKLDKLLPNDSYDATQFRDSCLQELDTTHPGFKASEMWNAPGGISEDCLYMNMWVPVKHDQDRLLVAESKKSNIQYLVNGFSLNSEDKATLLWVYGGSFSSGSANLNVYDGTLLAGLENVIVVSPNYRLGPFGFLYLNSEKAPGNAGLADIVLALEWYRENYLEFFGGSFNKICLFGESAGAMAIHNLLLSEKRNLFNRAILESSSSYLETSYRSKQDALQLGIHFAELTGCLPPDSLKNETNSTQLNSLQIKKNRDLLLKSSNEQILSCLLKQNATYLSQKQWEVEYVNEYLKMQFIPTSDYNKLITQDPSIYDFKADRNLNHDILAGVNENEGTYFLHYLYNGKNFNLSSFFNDPNISYDNSFVTKKLTESLKTKYPVKNDQKYFNEYVQCVSNLYTINGKQTGYGRFSQFDFNLDTEANLKLNSQELAFQKLAKILGDFIFACPTIKFANKVSEAYPENFYFYKFSQRSRVNQWPSWMGVIHGQEIEFVFGSPLLNPDLYDSNDVFTSRNIMSYWANFARNGKLNSKYDSIKNRDIFVDFTVDSSKENQLTEVEQMNLFNRLHVNCELINQFETSHNYRTKLKLCEKHHESIGSYFNSASHHFNSNIFIFLFICFILKE